jgi:peptidoglycan/xylan/chitin deacetylase (PgdA/CDA1 family)
VILEPNRRRRQRVFRALAGVVVVLFIGGLLASGWTLPAFSIAIPTASPPAAATPTAEVAVASTAPTATPIPTAPPPTLAPTPGPDGCIPPAADLQPATLASHGSRTDNVVALTFDDGNNAPNVELILGLLNGHHVNATFFPTARAVELAPKTWQLAAQLGFPLGNHTYHHASLRGQCFAAQVAEPELAKRKVGEATLTLQPYMRPPYEEFDSNTQLAAAAAGEGHVVLWDVDTLDWTGSSRQTIVNRALAGKAGSIILMHTTSPATKSALYEIIDKFQERGFRFVTIGQLLGIPGPVPFP